MTEQEKQLLVKALCGYLPYGFKYQVQYGDTSVRDVKKFILDGEYSLFDVWTVDEIKPYLRPMSSMTEEEYEKFKELDRISMHRARIFNDIDLWFDRWELIDWFNQHYFDYRGLIEKGMALEAPKGMYKI